MFRKLIERAARSYVAGADLADALGHARAIASQGLGSTLAYWNDVGEDPSAVCAHYLAAIDGAAALQARTFVSIKAPALSMRASHVETLCRRCVSVGVGLQFDSLAAEWQSPTLQLIETLLPAGAPIGCTLPGRFGQSLQHAERAIDWRLRVRVVKGQWSDPQGSSDLRAGFMALIHCLTGRAAGVAVATHDPVLARESLAALIAGGTPAELELLLGLPMQRACAVAREMNVPVRVYVPYGRAWLPYSLRAALANPRILLWLLKDGLAGGSPQRNRDP